MIVDFISYLLNVRMYRESSVNLYRTHLERLEAELGKWLMLAEKTSEIDAAIMRLSKKRKINSSSKDNGEYFRGRLSHYASLYYKWIEAEQIVNRNPYPIPSYRSAVRINPTPLENEQVNKILSCDDISLRNKVIFCLTFDANMRRGDIPPLDRSSIDMTAQVVRYKSQKSGRWIETSLSDFTINLIKKYLSTRKDYAPYLLMTKHGRRICNGGMQHVFELMSKKVGFRVRAHMGRHTKATVLKEAGVSDLAISQALDHSNINTTKLYTKIRPSSMREIHKTAYKFNNIHGRTNKGKEYLVK